MILVRRGDGDVPHLVVWLDADDVDSAEQSARPADRLRDAQTFRVIVEAARVALNDGETCAMSSLDGVPRADDAPPRASAWISSDE